MKTVLSALVLLALLASPAMAIGVSPSRQAENFVPNFEQNYTYTVFNNINESRYVNLYVTGDLARYVTLYSNGTYFFLPGEAKSFKFNVKLPSSLEPGRNEARIGAVEVAEPGAAVGGVAGVEMQYWVEVPYPEKYIAIRIEHQPKLYANEPVQFEVVLSNPGRTEVFTTADLEVQDANHTILERFELGYGSMAVGSNSEFTANWMPDAAGNYYAVARAYYEGSVTKKEMSFSVAEPVQPPVQQQTFLNIPLPDLTLYIVLIVALSAAIVIVLFWPGKRKNERKESAEAVG